MRLRCPAYPLITIDPYFNLWLMADQATADDTRHWTGVPNRLRGTAVIDGQTYRFFGLGVAPAMRQHAVEVDALTTSFVFEAAGVELTASFTTPLLPDQFEVFARPVTYLAVSVRSADGVRHAVDVSVALSEEFCLDRAGDDRMVGSPVELEGASCVRMGSASQKKLTRSGDDLRIEWGYLYLAVAGGRTAYTHADGMSWISGAASLCTCCAQQAVFALAYDDVDSLIYFGRPVKAWWARGGARITEVLHDALAGYDQLRADCAAFSDRLYADLEAAGGAQYAELCVLAYRQTIGAHKLAADEEGRLLFISKECFSNGCVATVDVSYPSVPQYLLLCPELVHGMLRPVLRYARRAEWPYDFAPHDAGQYPLVNGNVYGENQLAYQMPVEECGNLLVMAAAAALATGSADFARENMDLFAQWVKYLEQYGADPAEQLCTDDFAGHLAHNCNLSLKAIMGIAAYGLLLRLCDGDASGCAAYLGKARSMAASWLERAANGDGTYRLAFDSPGSYSLKYNAVWDKVFGTQVFPDGVFETEIAGYLARQNRYGMVLDNRADYTKSDWLVWAATLSEDRAKFEALIAPMWDAYHASASRVPLSDWYDTQTADHLHFRNRTVQGGLYMKLLADRGVCDAERCR